MEDAERDHIRRTLEQTRWVVSRPKQAAARLGIKRSTLYFRMQSSISRTNKDHFPRSGVAFTPGIAPPIEGDTIHTCSCTSAHKSS